MHERYSKINRLLKKKQSVLILGPRGTGKSFYINYLLKSCTEKIVIDLLETEAYD